MSRVTPKQFAVINSALIDRGYLRRDLIDDLETFGVASREAYAEYVRQQGVQVTAPNGTLVPDSLSDIPGDLLGALEADEGDETIDEGGLGAPADDFTSTPFVTTESVSDQGSNAEVLTEDETEEEETEEEETEEEETEEEDEDESEK